MKTKEVYISPFMMEYARKRNKQIVVKDGEIYLESIPPKTNWSGRVCWAVIILGSLGLMWQLLIR